MAIKLKNFLNARIKNWLSILILILLCVTFLLFLYFEYKRDVTINLESCRDLNIDMPEYNDEYTDEEIFKLNEQL